MKKPILSRLLITILSLILANNALAQDGIYLGADLLTANAKWKAYDQKSQHSIPERKVDGTSYGAGLTLGYKKSFNGLFASPEIFYDYLNSSTKDYYNTSNQANYKQDSLELRSRYGAKLNLGYDFNDKFASYLTYGLSSIDHVDNFPSTKFSQGKSKTSAIYGLGLIYNLNNNWSIKAEYNTQRFNVRYIYPELDNVISKVRLNVLKTGIVYKF